MSEKKDDKDWDFKVEGVKTNTSNVKRTERKARLAEKLGQKEEKRDAQKDLLESNKAKNMTVAGSTSSRKSRSRLAAEMQKEDEPDFEDLLAGPVKRVIAFAIDAAFLGGILFVVNSMWGMIELHALQLFRDNNINQTLDPETFKLAIMGIIGFVAYSLLIALPVCFTSRSWGKSFMKLSIHSSNEEKGLGFTGLFFREFIAKPISIATVVGPALCLFNREKKGLHDFVSGSVVMDDAAE